MRSLLDASRKLEQSFETKGIDCHTIVFMRNDVYQLLIEHTSDRGKEIRTSLDWSEPDLLRQLLRRRFLYNDLPDQPFEQLWRLIFVPFINGEESSQYLIDRSLMRPRFLLNAISHCRGFAVNLEHERIEVDDIDRGVSAYTTDLIYDIDLEIRDVLPFAEDVLYNFMGSAAVLAMDDIDRVLTDAGFDETQRASLIDIFLWYGVIGVMRDDGDAAYIYDVNYDVRRLKILIDRIESTAKRIIINPAFWSGLEIVPA
jgi:hypothetical protein